MNINLTGDDRDILMQIATTVERMDYELFGNGQPGRLQKMEDRLKSLETTRTESAAVKNTLLWVWGGVTAIVSACATLITHFLVAVRHG